MDALDAGLAIVLGVLPLIVRHERRLRALSRNASSLLSEGQKKARPAAGPNGKVEP